MINFKKASILFVALLFIIACNKVAGKTGKSTIHVHVINGVVSVPDVEVKVKYGASSFPGTSATYDDVIVADYTGKADFTNLARGDYYFYATFSDTSGTIYEAGSYVKINNKPGETHTVIDFSEADPF